MTAMTRANWIRAAASLVMGLGVVAAGAATPEATSLDSLSADIEAKMHSQAIPGLAASVVTNGHVIWSKGFGYADVDVKRPVTPETVFVMASVSKTVTAMALMLAVERGTVSLDANVNRYLPFKISNPTFPDKPITVRQLATHTSTILDNEAVYESPVNYHKGGDNPLSLGDFLSSYLAEGGRYYNPKRNFAHELPGKHWAYSNVGAGLAGYVVERAVGMPFDAFCDSRIFGPLAMNSTGWHITGRDTSRFAIPYAEKHGVFTAYPHYGLATYPDGGLRTTVGDLGRFLAMVMEGGTLDGTRIAAAQTIAAMLQLQDVQIEVKGKGTPIAAQGIFWFRERDSKGARKYWGHSGGDPGVMTLMEFDPATHVGAIVFTNIDPTVARRAAIGEVADWLINAAQLSPSRAPVRP